MSMIASFHVLDTALVPALAGQPDRVLAENAREAGKDYAWSGYVVLAVLDALDDQGIALCSSEHGGQPEGIAALLTPGHRRFVPQLEPTRFGDAEFKEIFDEFGLELDERESGAAGRETVALFRDRIAELGDGEVLVVSVG